MVELLVGAAIGLLLATWAISAFVSSLGNNRVLMAEARVNQGLRTAADLIARDLRRAGYWNNAIAGTITGSGASAGVTTANPFSAVAASPGTSTIAYNFSRNSDNVLDSDEQFGFQLTNGVIQMQTASGTWVPVTDANTVTITAMNITSEGANISVGTACPTVCDASNPTCPSMSVRTYGIVLTGQSVRDPSILRSLRTKVRVRNDGLSGTCP